MIDPLPIWAIAVAIAAIIAICGEWGFHIGANTKDSLHESPYGVLQAAIFGLLALLLAFSFSLGIARYDARRAAVVDEADSIKAVLRRSQLLDTRSAASMNTYLEQYLKARIAFAEAEGDERIRTEALHRSAALEERMWSLAVAQAHHYKQPINVQLFVESLENMFAKGDELEAILAAHIPDAVVIVLTIVIAFAAVLLGVGFGRTGRRGTVAIAFFAVVLAAVVGVNVDLDRPQSGFIFVNMQPLETLAQHWHQ